MRICRAKKSGFKTDVLLLLEHPPTITLGRNGKWQNLLVSTEELEARGISLHDVDRGEISHFMDLGSLSIPATAAARGRAGCSPPHAQLEESLILLLARYGIQAGRAGR